LKSIIPSTLSNRYPGNIVSMTFIITWSTSTGGAATVHRHSPVDALSKALALLVQGFEDVVIFDGGGKGTAYTPADFGKFFLTRGIAA
jgi:hypothetical protein